MTQSGRIPKSRYLEKEHAANERERLWPRVWLHAASADLVSSPGRFVTLTLGGVDVLLIRGSDGVVRAFHNVCQHRGRRLVDAPHGELETLRCPLHHWRYRLDGSLAHVPDRGGFGDAVDDSIRLSELPSETWLGHIFVHLGEPEQTLLEWLAPLTSELERYELDRYALVDQKTFELPCNWKTVADLFNEAYHVSAVHPYLVGSVDESTLGTTLHGPHVEQTFTIGRPGPHASPSVVTESLEELLEASGADPKELGGDARGAPELLRRALRARGIERLSDDELTTGRSWLIFPSQTLNVYPIGAMMHRHRPHPTDPERAWFDQLTFARVDEGAERPTPRVSFHVRARESESSGRVTEDDLREVVAVQRGMHSPGFTALRLGAQEAALLHMHEMIERYLGS